MDIESFLKEKGVPFVRLKHPAAFTAQEIAAEQHVPGRSMVKTVVVKADGGFYLAVLPAIYNIDFAKLKNLLGAKSVTLATEAEMEKLFPDAEVGAEAPFGEPYGLKTVVDEHLAESDEIVFQAGDHSTTIQLKYDDYVNAADADTGRFGQHI
jgi:Ala-tRNA(Pro) deacylase